VSAVARRSIPLAQCLVRYENGSKLAGIIYVHRISDERFTGIHCRQYRMFRQLCGDTTLENVVFVMNIREEVSEDVREAREKDLATNILKPVLDKGAQLACHHNTTQSAHDIIRRIRKNEPTALRIQSEIIDEHKDMTDTAAGEETEEERKAMQLIKQMQLQGDHRPRGGGGRLGR
jgi:hypothetical protein